MRVRIGRQRRGVVFVPVGGVETVRGVEVHIGVAEGSGQIRVDIPRPVRVGGLQQHIRGARGPILPAGALSAHSQPDGVQMHVLHERDELGGVFDGLLGQGHIRCPGAEVGVEGFDDGVLFQQGVVGERDIGIDDIAGVSQGRIVGVRIGPVWDDRGDIHPVAADILHQIGQNPGRRHHLEPVRAGFQQWLGGAPGQQESGETGETGESGCAQKAGAAAPPKGIAQRSCAPPGQRRHEPTGARPATLSRLRFRHYSAPAPTPPSRSSAPRMLSSSGTGSPWASAAIGSRRCVWRGPPGQCPRLGSRRVGLRLLGGPLRVVQALLPGHQRVREGTAAGAFGRAVSGFASPTATVSTSLSEERCPWARVAVWVKCRR